MVNPKFFRLEFGVILSVLLLYLQYRFLYMSWSRVRTFLHFLFLLVFAEIGACGLRTAIKLAFGTSSFLETFRHSNLLCISPNMMCLLAGTYAIAGAVFFVSVMYVGKMSSRGRRVFFMLVFPCTLLYPAMMGCLTQTSDFVLKHSVWVSIGIFATFAALAGMSVPVFGSNKALQPTATAPSDLTDK